MTPTVGTMDYVREYVGVVTCPGAPSQGTSLIPFDTGDPRVR